MELKDCCIAIIGAGVAGLSAAIVLAQSGAQVTVHERASEFREIGAGLQISPNGAVVLQGLGVGEDLDAISLRSRAVELRQGRSGARVLRLGLPEDGAGFHLVHRADLIAVLVARARAAGVAIHLQSAFRAVDLSGPAPRPEFDDQAVSCDLLLGADGVHSTLRDALVPDARAPVFTGQVAWRAVIPGEPDAQPQVQVFMGPGRHLVTYPLRGGALRNIVAVEERADWAAEGWHHRDDPQALRDAFSGFGGPVPGWLERVGTLYLWGLFVHPVAARWHGSHAAILGDAAHPTLPFMAQGSNMALEDAWVLGRCLNRAGDIATGLADYQRARHARVTRIVAAARANARNYHLRPPLSHLAHAGLWMAGRLAPSAPLRRFDWLYAHDVTRM